MMKPYSGHTSFLKARVDILPGYQTVDSSECSKNSKKHIFLHLYAAKPTVHLHPDVIGNNFSE